MPCVLLTVFFCSSLCTFAQEARVVGTSQQANERIRSLGTSSKQTPHEYTIGNGDLLSITVFDVPELSREVRVSQGGTISIPLVPARLHISGFTETQAEQTIADVLQANGLVSHPEVSVVVKEHKSRPITIVGAVQHPMVYEADSTVTLLEALAEAGGISNDAGDTIIVTRPRAATFIQVPNPEPVKPSAPGAALPENDLSSPSAPTDNKGASTTNPPELSPSSDIVPAALPQALSDNIAETTGRAGNIITINLNDLLETGDTRNNIPLQAGDIVTIPHAGIVYVLGAVAHPGGFILSNDRTQMTTLKILALAGGLTKIAKVDHAVIIRKDNQGKQTETELDLKKVIDRKAEDLQMHASDVLYIPDSHVKEALYEALQIATFVGTATAVYRVAYQ